ncbi:MAG: PIN domain-containing protein [Geminicoccaceae bacterium]
MNLVLVDSSVWVDYFRGVETMATAALDVLLGRHEAVVGDLVLMEVLQGYRSTREMRAAEAALGQLDCFDLAGNARARKAAANYRHLRSVGVTPRSTIDVLIASFCAEEDIRLLADDREFVLMAPHLGLAMHEVRAN